jgi:hypothetical protein
MYYSIGLDGRSEEKYSEAFKAIAKTALHNLSYSVAFPMFITLAA